MNLTKYKHIPFCWKPNLKLIPINEFKGFSDDNVKRWNKIYNYCKKNFMLVEPTRSGGISVSPKYNKHFRYFVLLKVQSFELVVLCDQGCYRFVIKNGKEKDKDAVTGRQACNTLYKFADNYGIDMTKYISDPISGEQIKQEIEPPHIKCMKPMFLCSKLKHVYHLDLNSAYASCICEEYPELKPMYDHIYSLRHENDGKYKKVLTNSIGCWQSEYCTDYISRHKAVKYQFAKLSKIAINGTRNKILNLLDKLRAKGCMPILTNTDGIWYVSYNGPYHDKNEGVNLGEWKTDHKDCDFLMTSTGSYQYVENGKCKTVVRGKTALDFTKPNRDDWEFGDILNIDGILVYKFDNEKGVYSTYE